jgi:hypothetical protein
MDRTTYRELVTDATGLSQALRWLADGLTEEAERLEIATNEAVELLADRRTTDRELGLILDLLVLSPDKYDNGRAMLKIAELAGSLKGRHGELTKRYGEEAA